MESKIRRIKQLLSESRRLNGHDPASLYLKHRCPGVDPVSLSGLRFHPAVYHGPTRENYPAMLGVVRGSDGKGITVHRTFLLGHDKAPIEPNRMVMPGKPLAGGAIRLFSLRGDTLGLAEGIETAISASLIHKVPVWSCISASGIASFVPPPGIKVIVFADHDEAGMLGAFRQVARSGANVEMPEGWKQDWNDVHRERHEPRA